MDPLIAPTGIEIKALHATYTAVITPLIAPTGIESNSRWTGLSESKLLEIICLTFIKFLQTDLLLLYSLYILALNFVASFYQKTVIPKSSNKKRHFAISILSVCVVALVCYPFSNVIGYRAVALVLLLTVSILAMRLSLYPVLIAAISSALIWDYFFIPPHFTFTVGSAEDALMLGMYFVIALLNGVLTARIRCLEELSRQKEERAKAVKLYDTLFNSLSHELRTPIATILGASDNLMTNSPNLSDESKVSLIKEINLASERLNRLVDNLLNMSRLDSGFIQPKLDWCDLNELIYTVVNRLETELRQHKINVIIPDNLPLFKLDFGLIEQTINNILLNAAIYTPLKSTISIKGDFLNNLCIITITDSGKGFPREDLELVFEKFYRSKNSRTGGIGLGLSIAKGFVDAHQGTIKLENDKSGGAKFTIAIPTETLVQKINEPDA